MKRQQSFKEENGKLYLVATPIGNLEDMTFRAVKTLQHVDLIYAEDTRVSMKLLKHYDITTHMFSYHEHNKVEKSEEIVASIKEGISIALISDAGYPIVSDPGYLVVQRAIEEDIDVVSIPGASALLHGLVVSGLRPHPFMFYGFLDAKKSKRTKELLALNSHSETMIFYESPHRIEKTLQDMLEVFGNRSVVIARELTKRYEEIIRGKLEDVVHVGPLKGEIVLLVEGAKEQELQTGLTMVEEVNMLIKNNFTVKDAIKQVAKNRNVPKNEVYQKYHID